eukprot:3085341-Pyramimonas_sp.AAC.1
MHPERCKNVGRKFPPRKMTSYETAPTQPEDPNVELGGYVLRMCFSCSPTPPTGNGGQKRGLRVGLGWFGGR